MMIQRRLPGILFLLGICICLLQIFVPKFFLTGDGPVHMYNAKILSDFWQGRDINFWRTFLYQNTEIGTNWSGHAVMATLMNIVSPPMAEKIFVALYALLFTGGFALVCRKLAPSAGRYLPLIGFLFVFNSTLLKGFYNFSLGLAMSLWAIWAFLRLMERVKPLNIALFITCTWLCYISHPLGWYYSALFTGLMLLFHALKKENRNSKTLTTAIWFAAAHVPIIINQVRFMISRNQSGLDLQFETDRLTSLYQFHQLVNYSISEQTWATLAGVVLLVTAVLALIRPGPSRTFRYGALIATVLLSLFIYLSFPDYFSTGGLMMMRAQVFFFLFCALLIASSGLKKLIKNGISLVLFGTFLVLSFVRMPIARAASEGVEDITSAARYLKPYSKVLPLSFNHNGLTPGGQTIADQSWLFTHAGNYLTADRRLLMLDNYEANTNYFPFRWVQQYNPYAYLSAYESIEGQPPFASINSYLHHHEIPIDYVVLWCYNPSFLMQGHVQQMMNEINMNFNLVYTSPSKRTMLYALKPPAPIALPQPDTTSGPRKIISDETLKVLNGE